MSDHDVRGPRLDGAYREGSSEQPPIDLDERIRAAAHRAVSARPQSLERQAKTISGRSWSARWRVPVSVAATVVLAVTVTLLVQEEEERRLNEEFPPAVSAPETQTAIPVKPGTSASESRPSEPVSKEAAKRVQSAPAASAPVTEEALQARKPMAPGPSSRPVEPRWEEARELAAPPVANRTLAPPARERDAIQSAPQTASGSETARPPSSDRGNAQRPEREQRSLATGASRTVEQWIEEIRRLKTQGRDAEAASELAEFRRRFPDYALPPDLAR
jgi:resuscitation-promoting factor RpfA